MDFYLLKIIKENLNRKIIYDDVAAPGIFSKRLVALLNTTNRRLNRVKVCDLYVPPFSTFKLETIEGLVEINLDNSIIFGIYCKYPGINITQEFLKMGGKLPENKQQIVLGVDYCDNVILGAY